MKVKRKYWEQLIKKPIDEVWEFFSRPENLNVITPEDMQFEILTPIKGVRMYEGMIVQYNVSPFKGVKLNWVTEITQIKERKFFIDEQRFGPYAFWHHQHHFEEVADGVLMKDILHYKVPYGFIGDIVNAIFVENKIEEIFRYRFKIVDELF